MLAVSAHLRCECVTRGGAGNRQLDALRIRRGSIFHQLRERASSPIELLLDGERCARTARDDWINFRNHQRPHQTPAMKTSAETCTLPADLCGKRWIITFVRPDFRGQLISVREK